MFKAWPNASRRLASRAMQSFAMAPVLMAGPAIGAYAQSNEPSYIEDVETSQRIDSSGKLRMISQRVVAAACYAQAGVETEATTALLAAATEKFNVITAALEFGNSDLGMHGAETSKANQKHA